jgi:hypothetical protein
VVRSRQRAFLAKVISRMFPLAHRDDNGGSHGRHQRLAVPFTFKPELRFSEALLGAVAAFLRILLGTILFAVWGALSLAAWSAPRSALLRLGLLLLLLLAFVLASALVLLGIGALVRAALKRCR